MNNSWFGLSITLCFYSICWFQYTGLFTNDCIGFQGRYHSYIGAIGFIMDGGGLKDLWAITYAAQSVKGMSVGQSCMCAH